MVVWQACDMKDNGFVRCVSLLLFKTAAPIRAREEAAWLGQLVPAAQGAFTCPCPGQVGGRAVSCSGGERRALGVEQCSADS